MSIEIQIGADISGVDKAIDQATKSIDKIRPVAANGANALNALSQVARDAPFGFIAIQNNLPILFDSLGALTKQAGGVGNALKSLGATLIGPAGVSFAIGAVIAGATALIQKYGSITEAVRVLLGTSKELSEGQKAYNKAINETSGNLVVEQIKVEALTKTLTNQKAPQADRIAAYGELKKIAPDVVAGIRDENALTKESSILIQANAQARKELVRLKIEEAGITSALTTNATRLSEKRLQETKLLEKQKIDQDKLNKSQKNQSAQARVAEQGINTYTLQLKQTASELENVRNEIKQLENEQGSYLNQLDPTVNKIAKINEGTRQRVNNIKDEDQALKDLTKSQKNALTQAEKDRQENLRNTLEAIKRQDFLNKTELETTRRNIEERRKLERESGITTPTQLPTVAPAMPMNVDAIKNQAQAATSALDFLKKEANMSAAYNLMNDTFFSPVENLFSNFLQTGKFAFKEFAQSILKAISQIVAKIIATGVVTLLASLFIPGFAAAGGGVGASLLSGITGALGFGGGGFGGSKSVAAPNFGGVSGGGMQMAGAVNLTLRGSDLVGSINRTNATINRVG
jgi:hypothetical protein